MAQMSPLRLTAYEWHGGGDSPLYSFASTGGKVHSEKHRRDLVSEIEGDIRYCGTVPPVEDSGIDGPVEKDRLTCLLAHVQQAEIGVEIEDSKGHYE